MYYLAAQNSTIKVAKRKQIESDAFLAPEFLPDLKKSYNKQEKMLRKLKCKDKDFTKIFSDFLYIGYWEQLSKATFLLRSRDIEVPEKLLDELLKMDVEKPHFVEKFYAKDWLNYYIKAIEDKKLITPTLKDYVLKTAVYFKNPELREFYVLNELEKKIKSNNLVFFEELFSSASSCVVSSEGKKKFLELFNKGKSALSEDKFDGVKAEEFVFITADGKEVALSDFKGKYVYIDFWATWCGPCKQETPHFKRLAERMQGNNIVFLSISVDNKGNEKIWKKYVQEHGLQKYCVAGWTGKGFKNSFISHYRINAIPRFMLVGPDGNMIYNDCWRPSSVQIDKLLNSFLN